MVVAGVGVDHGKLVEATQKYFVDQKPIWETDKELTSARNATVDGSMAQYTGGLVKVKETK